MAALLSLYLVALAVAAIPAPKPRQGGRPRRRITVLVPAHNEESGIRACVAALLQQTYPRSLFEVVVVADNCGDSTATLARAAGASVLERFDPEQPGKGHALNWAIDRLLSGERPPDAIAVVDADAIADVDLLSQLEAHLDLSPAVQAEYGPGGEATSRRAELVAAGLILFHRVRLLGRRRLGMPSALVGNGMLFDASLLGEHLWPTFTGIEDLEYTLQLRLAGVRPVYAPCARVTAPIASGYADGAQQRRRWEGGRLHTMRAWLPRLIRVAVRNRRLELLDAIVDLAVPPLTILGFLIACGDGLAVAGWRVGILPATALLPWALATAFLATFVAAGSIAGGIRPRAFLALGAAPAFLLWKAYTYLTLLRGFDIRAWDRTPRAGDSAAPGPQIGGVRIDVVNMAEARKLVQDALEEGRFHQIATINTDFIAQARVSDSVRAMLGRSWLNLPDGAPVVWISRLLGYRVTERVAGADLVPLLVADASERGFSTFLLGGERWSAALAAARLAETVPNARIAGWYEPPRASLEALPHDEILRRVKDSGADILMVALGHPKQDLWIDLQRSQLPVSVAIGVGCVFDLLADRVTRAPGWMQRAGLEWLFRALNEPRRLGARYAFDLLAVAGVGREIIAQRLGRSSTDGKAAIA